MAKDVEFKIRADIAEFERKMREVEGRLDSLGKQSDKASQATAGLGDGATKAAAGAGKLSDGAAKATQSANLFRTQVLGLGQGLGQLSPVVGRAASAASGFSAALGPVGLAVGAIAGTALPLLIEELSKTSKEWEDFAEQIREATGDLDDFIAKARDAERQRSRAERLRFGFDDATVEEIRGALAQREAESAVNVRRLELLLQETGLAADRQRDIVESAREGRDVSGRVGGIFGVGRDELEAIQLAANEIRNTRTFELEARDALTRAIGEENQALEDQFVIEQEIGREREEQLADRQRDAAAARASAAFARQQAEERRRELAEFASLVATLRDEGTGQSFEAAMAEELAEEKIGREGEIAELFAKQNEALEEQLAIKGMILEIAAKEEDAENRRLAILDQQRTARLAAFQDAGDIAEGALELFNASEGQKELARGLSQTAQAIGSYPDFVGIAQHGLSAALHFKNAADLGIGGGGATAAAPADRAPQRLGDTGGGGFGQVTVNINSPTDEAQLGMMFDRASREAERRFGA